MKRYYPILLSKSGEVTALTRLEQDVKDEISPVIKVLPDSLGRIQTFCTQHWSFDENEILLDFSLFIPFDRAAVRDFFAHLYDNDINAVPVVQENSDPRYISLVRQFVLSNQCKVCFRVSYTSGGFDNYNARIGGLMATVSCPPAKALLLIDLEYAEANNHVFLSAVARDTIQNIPNLANWPAIIVAAGSFPDNLSLLHPGNIYELQRFEWNIWNTIHNIPALSNIVKYGDYGTKYPYYSEVNFPGCRFCTMLTHHSVLC